MTLASGAAAQVAPKPQAAAPTTEPVPTEPQPAASRTQLSLALLAGHALPINGHDYAAGAGLAVALRHRILQLGAALLLHQGDEVKLGDPGVPGLGIPSGEQKYTTSPVFVIADAGVAFDLPIGSKPWIFAPFVGAALLFLNHETSGVYGDGVLSDGETVGPHDGDPHLAFAWGMLLRIPITYGLGLGLQYRMVALGDVDLTYGDLGSGTIPHGYSTSTFYHAPFVEVSYTF